jgi:hypothetical protein
MYWAILLAMRCLLLYIIVYGKQVCVLYWYLFVLLILKQRPETGNRERYIGAEKQGTVADEVPVTQTSPNKVSQFLM